MDSLGTTIRDARKKLNMTMVDLAEQSNLTQGYLSKIENNVKIPTREVLQKLSNLLGIPFRELMIKAGYLNELNAELKSKVTLYVTEIMDTEIKVMHSQKYKELYDLDFRAKTIEILLDRYNFEGLSDVGIKQYIKEILDEYLDKIIYEKKYKPHCNESAINLISDRLDDVFKKHLNSYFKEGIFTMDHLYLLENDEIKSNLSYELYTQISKIILNAQDEINNLKKSF